MADSSTVQNAKQLFSNRVLWNQESRQEGEVWGGQTAEVLAAREENVSQSVLLRQRFFSARRSSYVYPAKSGIEEVTDRAVICPDRRGYVSITKRG